ncbi:MAG TPA: UDP-3-O-(3-hydroxymyristoyl)glucosamine N-acyltransferase, partial [Blastocatellia bacterium]|nr:UDP-3-O-(3-hydroxymyristoyl)glucosamine N-acyltransferase [Blastocatellia bacterium]
MANFPKVIIVKLAELAVRLGCELEGDGAIDIAGVATLESAGAGDLSFFTNPKYHNEAKTTRASAILVGHDCPPMQIALLRHNNPYLAFAKAVEIFFKPAPVVPSIHPTAWVSDSAVIGNDVYIGPYAHVGERVVLGTEVQIHTRCTIHEDAVIGDGTVLHSGCVVRERIVIGKRCIIQSNSVIGSDGFGYAKQQSGEWYRILQAGTVVIEDDVEIGACTTIDRAALGETRIQKGTKIDNQVHIAHGCIIGPNNLLAAQVGLAGSTKTGTGVILTGQVGAAGHLTIGDGAVATPQTGIANSVEAGMIVSGAPAIDHRNWLKSSIAFSKLPELQKTVRRLEARVA